jgi:putative ABC transport system substrate-binding protein
VGLLREIAPRVARIALLFNPATAPFFEYYLQSFNAAAASFGMEAITAPVLDMSGLESVVAAVVYPNRFFAELGGLLSYGVDLSDNFRHAAPYADRILKGEKPADLPVQAPTRYELVINLKTAKALGLTVPATVYALADGIIQ